MLLLLTAATVIAQLALDAPNQQPWLAAADRQVALAFGSGNDLYVATSGDEGRTFRKPVRLPNQLKLALGRHRGPRVAIAGRTIVVSAIGGAAGRGQDGDLLAWRSADSGRTWSEPVRINDVEAAAREGLHGMAAHGDRLFASWLDLRQKGTRIYGAWSADGGATWSKNVLVYESPDGTVCQCCHPTVTIASNGDIYVMFRNVLAGNRDMYVAKSTDGGRTFSPATKLGSGSWKLNACPMDGGGIAVTGSALVSTFRRDGQILIAPDGKSEKAIGEGRDPAIVATKKGNYVAWSAPDGIHVLEPGQASPRTLGPDGKYVYLIATSGERVLAAWEQNGTIVLHHFQP